MEHRDTELPIGAQTDRVDIHDVEVDPASLLAHLARYMFVSRQLDGTEKLIEVGAGTGYGAMTLSKVASKVVAYDPYVVSSGLNEKWAGDRLMFVDSLKDLSSFDVVVALEVIEHMTREDADTFLESLKSLGHAKTRWFISTPRVLPDEDRTENRKRAHPFEYTFGEFRSVLKDHFDQVHIFQQNDGIISSQNPKMAWNFMAVCTN